MNNKSDNFSGSLNVNPQELRQRAEKDPRAKMTACPSKTLSLEESAQLIHELQVHQIELEMQNDTLRESQIQLQRSREQYFDLYDLAPVGYLTLNDKLLITESNYMAAQLLGVNKSVLLHQPLSQFIVPEDEDAYYLYCRQMLSATMPLNCELRLRRTDDKQLWVSLQTITVHNEGNGIRQLRIIISDINQQKKTEQQLSESEERLDWVMEANDAGVWDWDIHNKQVIHNDKWFKLLGLKENNPQQPLAFFTKLIHEDDREKVLLKLRQALAGDGRFQSEHRLRHADGSYLWVLESGIVVKRDKAGKPLRMVGSFIDISERKHAEQLQRLLQQQYEQLLKLEVVSQTISAIAHELNQPLSAAASYIDTAQRLVQGHNIEPNKVAFALAQGGQQIQRAGGVVRDLFKFLRSGEIITQPLDLNQVVCEVLDTFKQDGHFKGYAAILDLASDLPRVNANLLQLKMVFSNLLSNSIDAMSDAELKSGTIIVTVRTAKNGTCAQLTVSDNGPGISEQALQRLFEPFYTTKPQGLGMGLVISRALIEAQGGQLWCQPEAGGSGATFHLTLPFATEASQ